MARLIRRTWLTASLVLFSACSTAPPPTTPTPNDALVPAEYVAIPRADREAGIELPKVLRRVDPTPTLEMLRRRPRPITATVEAVINPSGAVEAVWYSSGDREWAQHFATVLHGWQFEPARRDGVPIAVRFVLTSTIR